MDGGGDAVVDDDEDDEERQKRGECVKRELAFITYYVILALAEAVYKVG